MNRKEYGLTIAAGVVVGAAAVCAAQYITYHRLVSSMHLDLDAVSEFSDDALRTLLNDRELYDQKRRARSQKWGTRILTAELEISDRLGVVVPLRRLI
jgi:hypothetical protein